MDVSTHDNNLPYEYLTTAELYSGCKLLLDTGADTFVVYQHTQVGEVIEEFTANAKGFDNASQILENLPMVNFKYALDLDKTGQTIISEVNHCIYLGARKTDGILCPNQLRMNGVYIDDIPSTLFPAIENIQYIIADVITTPLQFYGPQMKVLPWGNPTITSMICCKAYLLGSTKI